MFVNRIPKTGKDGEIRYYAFHSHGKNPSFLAKVKCVRRWYDKENDVYVLRCEVLEDYFNQSKVGNFVQVDDEWHLQETLEDAMRLLVILSFDVNKSYDSKPGWE